ncbi:MAG: phosphomannose isomerase type II C-terminal cupin domain [bacterium]
MDNISTSKASRPWGEELWINSLENICKVKIISINKGESLSLQYHNLRSEFWKILEGSAYVKIGDKTFNAKVGDEFYIPINEKHQISAPDSNCTFLEVAGGKFDQEDIVRLEDKYGRIKKT